MRVEVHNCHSLKAWENRGAQNSDVQAKGQHSLATGAHVIHVAKGQVDASSWPQCKLSTPVLQRSTARVKHEGLPVHSVHSWGSDPPSGQGLRSSPELQPIGHATWLRDLPQEED